MAVSTGSTATTDAPSAQSHQKTYAVVAFGAGATAIVVGSVTGLIAIGKHGTLVSECPDGKCRGPTESTLDGYRSMATVSTIAFVMGGVAAAAGGALWLTAPKEMQTGRVEPYVGLGQVGARVRF
jgi:hypothetical protein